MAELEAAVNGGLDLLVENRWVRALLILALSILAAIVVDKLCSGVIRVWARRTRTDLDDRLLAHVHRPIYVSVLLIGLAMITRTLRMTDPAAWITLAALKTVAVFVWLGFLFKLTSMALAGLARLRDRFEFVQERTVPLLDIVIKFALAGGSIYFVFLAWHIDVTAWLASAGIIGLALSFAAQDSLANLFAGLFILADSPYKMGDYVVLDSGERGMVTTIGMRSTRLLTRDDVEITIPNSVMGNAKIINESGGPHTRERIRLKVGVAYGSDIDRVEEVLLEIAGRHDEICSKPAPRVRFRAFGDSSLDFELLAWIEEPADRGRLLHELHREVYKAFNSEAIQIPFPQRDLWIREMPQASS